MKKVLFVSNIAKKINSFSLAGIQAAHKLGFDFHMAANWLQASDTQKESDQKTYGVSIHHIDLERSPFSFKNVKAYRQLVKLIREEQIDYIHCNTPVGGILGRLAGKKCKVKKVIYQAHGFHFYEGAPKLNWLLYYPIEKWLARYTDAIITINQEDYKFAKAKIKPRKGGMVYYVPGVGIDLSQYESELPSRTEKRAELGLRPDDIALISMGDLIKRKNYETAIRAISEANNNRLQYFICGKGPEEGNLKALAESLNVTEQIHFLGYRSDVKELLALSDIFLFTTKQEGLARSMMEAMASGLPCVASKIRGNTDLLEAEKGGFLCNITDFSSFAEKINLLAENSELRETMRQHNLEVIQKFSIETVKNKISHIYHEEFNES